MLLQVCRRGVKDINHLVVEKRWEFGCDALSPEVYRLELNENLASCKPHTKQMRRFCGASAAQQAAYASSVRARLKLLVCEAGLKLLVHEGFSY